MVGSGKIFPDPERFFRIRKDYSGSGKIIPDQRPTQKVPDLQNWPTCGSRFDSGGHLKRY
jgi:hypothetical protein